MTRDIKRERLLYDRAISGEFMSRDEADKLIREWLALTEPRATAAGLKCRIYETAFPTDIEMDKFRIAVELLPPNDGLVEHFHFTRYAIEDIEAILIRYEKGLEIEIKIDEDGECSNECIFWGGTEYRDAGTIFSPEPYGVERGCLIKAALEYDLMSGYRPGPLCPGAGKYKLEPKMTGG